MGPKLNFGKYLNLAGATRINMLTHSIIFENCTFTDNLGWPSSALSIENRNSRFMLLYDNVLLRNISISNNYIPQKYENVYSLSGQWDPITFVVIQFSTVYSIDAKISNCTLLGTTCSTGLLAIEANLYFEDSVAFSNNTGRRGGGPSLINSSHLLLMFAFLAAGVLLVVILTVYAA